MGYELTRRKFFERSFGALIYTPLLKDNKSVINLKSNESLWSGSSLFDEYPFSEEELEIELRDMKVLENRIKKIMSIAKQSVQVDKPLPLELITGATRVADRIFREDRLKKLEYLLNQPKKESYRIKDKTIELTLDDRVFLLLAPQDTPVEKLKLFSIVTYDEEKSPKLMAPNINGNNLYIVSRDYIKSENVKEKLKEAAKKGGINIMYPLWSHRDEPFIHTNRISVKPKSPEKKDPIKSFARKNGLKLLKEMDHLSFDLSNSRYVSPFESFKALLKYETVEWCEPDFIIQRDLR